MTYEDILPRLLLALNRAQVPYMLTGSVASSTHGLPRSTQDINIVIAPTRSQLVDLISNFPEDRYYADEQQSLNALEHGSQFNIIDFATGWKVDFIISENSPYGRQAFARRTLHELGGVYVCVVSPEDAVLSKLQWAKTTGSERQLRDVAGILAAQGDKLDIPYIEKWICQFALEDIWETVRKEQC